MLPIVSVGKRQELPGRIASHRAGSDAAADPACDRHPDRRRRLGAAAAGTGALVGRHTRHRERPGHRRRGRRRADCRRREVRQTRLVVPDEPDLEGVADDLHVRRAAAHRRRGGRQHPRVRAPRLTWQAFHLSVMLAPRIIWGAMVPHARCERGARYQSRPMARHQPCVRRRGAA